MDGSFKTPMRRETLGVSPPQAPCHHSSPLLRPHDPLADAEKKEVLFIGTQFSNLSTALDTPNGAMMVLFPFWLTR
jgi:hypothetical protein